MVDIPENVRQVLVQLLPANIIKDITCYVFYDNHPRDDKKIDITVVTKMGEVKEYFQRDLLSSVKLENTTSVTKIEILRNSRCKLFYLVVGVNELLILSRRDKLRIHNKLLHVSSYKLCDTSSNGQALLKVVTEFDQIPVVADDNFENFRQEDFTPSPPQMEGAIITHLMRKLIEAKYSVKCNEKALNEFVNIRQTVAYSIYKKIHPNLEDSVFKDGGEKMATALKVCAQKPWIKACNKKLVIVYNVYNQNVEHLEEVQILLHGTTRQTVEYSTKIFEKQDTLPYWKESCKQTLVSNKESAIVVVIDYEELKDNVISKMEFNGVLIYKKSQNECVMPIDDVKFSPLDTMGEQFDVMCSNPMDNNIMLAVLASTEKTDLILRQVKNSDESSVTFNIFCEYLKMERVNNDDNIVIHRHSPYHVLNGIMIVLNSNRNGGRLEISVYSRSPSQVLALQHLIQDIVPYTIVITTPTHKITAKDALLTHQYNEHLDQDTKSVTDYTRYAPSMLNRTGLVLQYLDNCMIHMSESKNPVVQNKIGSEIDLFAQGETGYKEFKEKMREEAANGVKMLEDKVLGPVSDAMCVD